MSKHEIVVRIMKVSFRKTREIFFIFGSRVMCHAPLKIDCQDLGRVVVIEVKRLIEKIEPQLIAFGNRAITYPCYTK